MHAREVVVRLLGVAGVVVHFLADVLGQVRELVIRAAAEPAEQPPPAVCPASLWPSTFSSMFGLRIEVCP